MHKRPQKTTGKKIQRKNSKFEIQKGEGESNELYRVRYLFERNWYP